MIRISNSEDAIRREYDRVASRYDRRWSYYIQATLGETLKRLDLQNSDRLLDIGCGTAALFQAILAKYPSIGLVGVDISSEMLRVACKKSGNGAQFLAGQAQVLPLRSQSFDVVVSCNTFHYWRKPETCLNEIIRVLKPTGRVVITDWCDDYLSCRVCDLFLKIVDAAHFKTYRRRELELLLRAANFRNIHVEKYKINWLWGLMTARAS